MTRVIVTCVMETRDCDMCGDMCGSDMCDGDTCDCDMCDGDMYGSDMCDGDMCGSDMCDGDICDGIKDADWNLPPASG